MPMELTGGQGLVSTKNNALRKLPLGRQFKEGASTWLLPSASTWTCPLYPKTPKNPA